MAHKLLSTNKIIIYVIIFSALLIAAQFFTRMHQKPTFTPLAANEGVLFPVPRDIKAFELATKNNAPFSQKDFLQHWTLLFFGFTHCSDICPTTLDTLNKTYQKLQASYPALQVVFISLDPERDNTETVARYAHSFNSNFIGVTGKTKELHKLQSQLGIFSARDTTTQGEQYQINHTPSILLINPQGKWAAKFHYGLTPAQLQENFIHSVNALSNG